MDHLGYDDDDQEVSDGLADDPSDLGRRLRLEADELRKEFRRRLKDMWRVND